MILRVFPERTAHTPDDPYVRIGAPSGTPLPADVTEIHISCLFTWHRQLCLELQDEWWTSGVPVRLGGPAFASPAGEFTPGKYVTHGISISSRGCPNKCSFCLVPEREGDQRLLPICPGNQVQDNNISAFPRRHFQWLCRMLKTQRGIVFSGGLEAARLRQWHVEALRSLSPRQIRELWFAADHNSALPALRKALDKVRPMFNGYADYGRRKLRCYVMIGYKKETIAQASARLESVWDAGCLPFAQLYRSPKDGLDWRKVYSPKWRALEREWARPAAMYAQHRSTH